MLCCPVSYNYLYPMCTHVPTKYLLKCSYFYDLYFITILPQTGSTGRLLPPGIPHRPGGSHTRTGGSFLPSYRQDDGAPDTGKEEKILLSIRHRVFCTEEISSAGLPPFIPLSTWGEKSEHSLPSYMEPWSWETRNSIGHILRTNHC